MKNQFDYLVIGSGIAGLTFALKAARSGSVAIVTKKDKLETNTNYAQGGIASVFGQDDSFEPSRPGYPEFGRRPVSSRYRGFCRKNRPGPDQGSSGTGCRLQSWAPTSTRSILGREGGHSRNRILHAQDMTGKAVEKVLMAAAESDPNIVIFEHHLVLDLVIQHHSMKAGSLNLYQQDICRGAYVLDMAGEQIHTFVANAVLLCTGGAGKVYLYTSNPDVATGDGLAIAYRAGAKLANLEFVQFHPTCLYHPAAKNFLISEAVRGEGGRLIDRRGRAFMEKYHPLKDLAFRDIVARAIDTEMKTTGDDCVFLDISHRGRRIPQGAFPQHLPEMSVPGHRHHQRPYSGRSCRPLHVRRDLTNSSGQTTIQNLYAIGECACTGLHGANRLASNSLLEAMVFAHAAAGSVPGKSSPGESALLPDVPDCSAKVADQSSANNEMVLIAHNWDFIRRLMWNYVGIVRTDKRLALALNHIRPDKDGTKGAHAENPCKQRPRGTSGARPGGRTYHPDAPFREKRAGGFTSMWTIPEGRRTG